LNCTGVDGKTKVWISAIAISIVALGLNYLPSDIESS
jgi:hypothetical protein